MALTSILKDCTIFTDTEVKIGESKSITLPNVEEKTEGYLNGGMAGEVNVSMGCVEAMQLEFTLTNFDRQVLKLFGFVKGNNCPFTVRGWLQDELVQSPGDGVNMGICHTRGRISKIDFGSWEHGTASEVSYTVEVFYYQLLGGADGTDIIHDIDLVTGTRMIVGGVDLRAGANRALGIS